MATVKKEFVTRWMKEDVGVIERQTVLSENFYENKGAEKTRDTVVRPDDISYLELLAFVGKKTRITIEVIG